LRDLVVIGAQLCVELRLALQIVVALRGDIVIGDGTTPRCQIKRLLRQLRLATRDRASRLATCAFNEPTSAVVKVGSSVANSSPFSTFCPSATSIVLMIDWSSAPSTTVGSTVTISPLVDEITRSTRMHIAISKRLATSPMTT
jgi:hypothetical protein